MAILRALAVPLLLAAVGVLPFRAPIALADNDWVSIGEEDGLKLYEKQVPGSKIVALKFNGVVDYPLLRVASVVMDHSRAEEWIDRIEELRLVRRLGPLEYIEYSHIDLPILLKDREFVTRVGLEFRKETKSLFIRTDSVDDPSIPPTGNIRGEIHTRYDLRSLDAGKKTDITIEIHADPKGQVPKWVVNMFQRSWPTKTFAGIKKQLAKPDIQVPEPFKDVLSQLEGY